MQALFGVAVLVFGMLAAVGAHLYARHRIAALPDPASRKGALGVPWFLAVIAIFNASALGTTFGTRIEMNEGAETPGEPVGGDFVLFLFWVSVAIVVPFLHSARAVAKLERATRAELHRIDRALYLRVTAAYLISGVGLFASGGLEPVHFVVDLVFGSWAPAHTALLLGLELSVLVVAVAIARVVHRLRTGTWQVPAEELGEE